jgi:hypothetical protein
MYCDLGDCYNGRCHHCYPVKNCSHGHELCNRIGICIEIFEPELEEETINNIPIHHSYLDPDPDTDEDFYDTVECASTISIESTKYKDPEDDCIIQILKEMKDMKEMIETIAQIFSK